MKQEEFKNKVSEWLKTEGNCVLGTWGIEPIEQEDAVRISVRITIQNINIVGYSITENKEETIMTAVLGMNDQLVRKLL